MPAFQSLVLRPAANACFVATVAVEVKLIFLGAEVLWASTQGSGRVRIGFSGLALIGLLILISGTFRGCLPGLTLRGCNYTGIGPVMVTHQLDPVDLTIDWEGIQSIALDTTFGQVTVYGQSAGEDPSVTLTVRGQAPTGSEAALGAGVRVTRSGTLLALSASGERTGITNTTARADLLLSIPSDLALEITSEHGAVTIEDYDGLLDVSTRFGRIRLDGIDGPTTVRSDHGEIYTRDLNAKLTIDATYGAVDVTNIAGPVNIVSKHGAIDLNEPLSDVAVETTYGNISIRYGAPPAGPCLVKSRHGSILVKLPGSSQLTVEATATRSRITTNLPGLTVQPVGQGSRAEGTVHSEGALLTADTEYGRLELRGY